MNIKKYKKIFLKIKKILKLLIKIIKFLVKIKILNKNYRIKLKFKLKMVQNINIFNIFYRILDNFKEIQKLAL